MIKNCLSLCLVFCLFICFSLSCKLYSNSKNKNLIDDNDSHTFAPKNPYEIYIDLSEHMLYLFKDKEILYEFPVAGGTEDTPSPFGVWKVIEKSDWGEGFGGHWIGLNVPWGIYGIHGTSNPGSIGHSASHGCIRMFNGDAEKVSHTIPIGTPVAITNGPYSPFGRYPRTVVPGDRGSDVLHIQMILKKKGLYSGALDGIYGDGMKSAVFAVQNQNGITPHNQIDQDTMTAMGIFLFE